MARHEVYQPAIPEQRHRRAAGRVLGEVAACARHRLHILAGEDRSEPVGSRRLLQRQPHAGSGHAGGAAADRVDHEQHGARLLRHEGVHIFRRQQLLKAEASQLLAHRLHQSRIVRHNFLQVGAMLVSIAR